MGSIDFAKETMFRTREAILKIVDSVDFETLNIIPEGFNNNLVWHFGHVVVTPQMLAYKNSGLPYTIDEVLVEKYRKGSKPEGKVSVEELDILKKLLFETVETLHETYKAGRFQTYNTVVTSLNVTLDSIDKAIPYCAAHDNLHFGYMQALKRVVCGR
ncbi:MAG: DinB family protein [Chitinophagaceae bacterium]